MPTSNRTPSEPPPPPGDKDWGPRARHALPVWKKALFALVATVVFFAFLEGGLALMGVRPGASQDDPYVGFASTLPLYVKQKDPDGRVYMITAPNKNTYFNFQRFAPIKPDGTYRIFCLGGSTTYGRPYGDVVSFSGWLREFLPVADPQRNWEVINAGGISYASYRVAAVMKQLLRYQPDLFIIYSGHNEFLERRTYPQMIGAAQFWTEAGALVSRTRLYGAGRGLWGAVDLVQPSGNMLPGEVHALLDHSVGPSDYYRDDALRAKVIEHYRWNLNRMVSMAREANAKVVLVTPASNLKDCSPFKSQPADDLTVEQVRRLTQLRASAQTARASRRWGVALAALDKATAIDERAADLHYQRGQCLYEMRLYERAKAAFERALDEDVCPLRILPDLSAIVAEVSAQNDVPLLDFAQMIEQRSEYGITGSDYFVDQVHLTMEGYRLLGLALVDTMEAHGMVTRGSGWTTAALEELTAVVTSRVDRHAQGVTMRNLAKVLTWAGKLDEAHRMAAEAAKLLGDDSESQFLMGLGATQRREYDVAIRYFREALRIKPDYGAAHYNLGITLQNMGQTDSAMEHFDHALRLEPHNYRALHNMGRILELQGKIKEAAEYYRRALKYQPDLFQTHYNLAATLERLDEPDAAIDHYRQAVAIRPDDRLSNLNLGRALQTAGQPKAALVQWQKTQRVAPDWPPLLADMAWLLSTHPDSEVRDNKQALRFAQRAIVLTRSQDPEVLDTAAAAYAAAGRFDTAVKTAQAALDLVDRTNVDLAQQIRARLALYRQGKPYVQ